MNKILFQFGAILLSLLSCAYGAHAQLAGDDPIVAPMEYSLYPMVGAHFALSELSGSQSVNPGAFIGLGFRFQRDGYFFTPNVRLIGLGNVSGSSTLFTGGFIAGGRVPAIKMSVFVGGEMAEFLSGPYDATGFGKVGVILDLNVTKTLQLVVDAFFTIFSSTTTLTGGVTQTTDYPYGGVEAAISYPINL